MLDRIEIQEIATPLHRVLLLAEKERLKAYDASYTWLARELGVELVTLEGDLAERFGL